MTAGLHNRVRPYSAHDGLTPEAAILAVPGLAPVAFARLPPVQYRSLTG